MRLPWPVRRESRSPQRKERIVKAARLHRYDEGIPPDSLTVEEIEEPKVGGPLEVIVRVGAAGLCRTDIHVIEGQWAPIQDPDGALLPYVPGHENAGWVEEVGSGVTNRSEERRVGKECRSRWSPYH